LFFTKILIIFKREISWHLHHFYLKESMLAVNLNLFASTIESQEMIRHLNKCQNGEIVRNVFLHDSDYSSGGDRDFTPHHNHPNGARVAPFYLLRVSSNPLKKFSPKATTALWIPTTKTRHALLTMTAKLPFRTT
jgi:hypothetical protein